MSTSEVKVGALTLGGAAIMAGIISFMGAFHFGSGGYELKISYPQVSGLVKGHVVRYAGVQVGTVKEIGILPDRVEVTAQIEDKIKIPEGAVFSISADGIMGEKFVNIIPPAKTGGGYIAAGSQVRGVPGGGMEEFFSSSGDVMAKVENIADAFNTVFGDKEVQQSMREGLVAMGEISRHMSIFTRVMADVAVDNQQHMNRMLLQMSELTARMNGIAGHLENIMDGVDNNGATGRSVAEMAEHLARTSARVENVVKLLENVAGDPETEKNLKATLQNAREASERANKVLGTLTEAKISLDAGHNLRGSDWRGNLGVTLQPDDGGYLYVGGYDLGGANKLDLIAGKKFGSAGLSAGAMQGEFGVGLSYDLGRSVKLYGQLYDFDDAKLRLGGELRLTDSVSLYGESMDVRRGSRRETYVGLRSRF